jgi:hypothetical protein
VLQGLVRHGVVGRRLVGQSRLCLVGHAVALFVSAWQFRFRSLWHGAAQSGRVVAVEVWLGAAYYCRVASGSLGVAERGQVRLAEAVEVRQVPVGTAWLASARCRSGSRGLAWHRREVLGAIEKGRGACFSNTSLLSFVLLVGEKKVLSLLISLDSIPPTGQE